MPTYDFQCESCGHKFSMFTSIQEKDQVTCPQCQGKTKQLFTGFLYKKSKSGGDSAASTTSRSCSASSCAGCSGC